MAIAADHIDRWQRVMHQLLNPSNAVRRKYADVLDQWLHMSKFANYIADAFPKLMSPLPEWPSKKPKRQMPPFAEKKDFYHPPTATATATASSTAPSAPIAGAGVATAAAAVSHSPATARSASASASL